MLRYNRKNARNQGVTSPCLRPVALASAPKTKNTNSLVNSSICSNIYSNSFQNDSIHPKSAGHDNLHPKSSENDSIPLRSSANSLTEKSHENRDPQSLDNDHQEERRPGAGEGIIQHSVRDDLNTINNSDNENSVSTAALTLSPMESLDNQKDDSSDSQNDFFNSASGCHEAAEVSKGSSSSLSSTTALSSTCVFSSSTALSSTTAFSSASALSSKCALSSSSTCVLASSSTTALTSSTSPSSSPLALDDRSIANIECLGLRLIYLLSNSAESIFNRNFGSQVLRCFRWNLRQLISDWLQRIVDGIDGGFRRWKRMWMKSSSTMMSEKKEVSSAVNSVESEGGLEAKSKGSRHVFLVRHGQYFSKERSDRQKRLTRLGREQLILTGRRLREVGFEYDAVVSSTMTRAKESAKIIIDQLRNANEAASDPAAVSMAISVDKLLEEGAPLPPEPPLDFWQPNAAQFRADGPRIERAFQKYFAKPKEAQEKDSHDIIVCHANVIRYCVCRALQVPPQAWLRIWLNHGSITWLTIRPEGRIVLRALGASGWMPPEKLTAN